MSLQEMRRLLVDTIRGLADLPGPILHTHFPPYGNIGDSAIWVAEQRLLRQVFGNAFVPAPTEDLIKRIVKRCALGRFTIVLRGGGNFGSLWSFEHDFRLRLMRRYPSAAFIQMPQSVHFEDADVLEETRRCVRQCHRFCLMTRDRVSFDQARRVFDCPVYLVPDAALLLDPKPSRAASKRAVHVMRGDHEARQRGMGTPEDRYWTQDPKPILWLQSMAMRIRSPFGRSTLLDAIANARLRRGWRLLSQADELVTDRLHAHILATLMGIPHTLYDTAQGKTRAFYETWTRPLGTATLIDVGPEEAQASDSR